MNLIIDVGNTRIKLAVFDDQTLQFKKTCRNKEFLQTLSEIVEEYPALSRCIISSVGDFDNEYLELLSHKFSMLILTGQTKVPFKNDYSTPSTLGVDRIALISAAATEYPGANVLVIDAGSCITYDFINAKNEYLGGAISPGIEMRYEALNSFTANLPLLKTNLPEKTIGDSTKTSIHSGVVNGVLYEIDGFIRTYIENYSDLTIILTGGDAHFLRDSLKNDIFANPNFLLVGLNYILEHNRF